jgi:hypothetical protein
MKTWSVNIMLTGILLLGLASCAVTDFDRSADFKDYQTFRWGKSKVDVSNPLYNSDLINKKIRQTVENEFAKRGIVKNDRNPDFIVSFHTYTEKKEQLSGGAYPYSDYPYFPFRFSPFAFGWGYPYYMSRPAATAYTQGTLIIDIMDGKSRELVWRGSVSGNVDDAGSLKRQIEKGIKAIMRKYPVTPDAPLNIGNDAKTIS